MLDYRDIAKIFEEIELRLIAGLKRNLARHKQEESREGFKWSAWQAEKLRNIERFRKENQAIMDEYTDVIDMQTRELMAEQFREGEESVLRDESIKAWSGKSEESWRNYGRDRVRQNLWKRTDVTPKPKDTDAPHFFGVNEQKMQALMEDITMLEKTAETAAMRMTDDIYRQTLNRVQLAMGTGEMTLNKAIDLATRDFLDKGINCIVYSDGKRLNIADYVRMALRTTSERAALQGKAKRFAELGYDTVIVSQYGGCSKTCEPWQGQVYIDDVFTVWEGEHDEYQGKSNYCGEWFWLLSYAVKNGLFHPNCRHTMSQYIHGVTEIPEPIPAEKIKKQRELEQKQRYLERKIRKFKRLAEGTLEPETARDYSRKLRQAQKELREFISEHEDVLKRDSSREKVYGGEDLTNERNRRILKEKIAKGDITLTLNPEKQNPHILGSDEYNPSNNKSYFDIAVEELQQIVDENHATGEIRIKSNGQIKEVIVFENECGTVIDKNGEFIERTNRTTIHYSKKRTHIVPTKKEDKGNES